MSERMAPPDRILRGADMASFYIVMAGLVPAIAGHDE
jgi:hypothetical protein